MIQHFFECSVPVSKCNLQCEYCYVIQDNRRNISTPSLQNALFHWKEAISSQRIGKCFFSFCGYGETMLGGKEFLQIVRDTLECGHIVNITNNGTITDAIEYLLTLPTYMQKKLLLSFSLHYDELKKRKLLDVFSQNVKRIMQSEISCFVQINLCDSYINKSEEIKKYCTDNFGCLPQVATTRRVVGTEYHIYTDLSDEDYAFAGEIFESPLFAYTFKNFSVTRTEFCYAGEFSYKLNIATGELQRCYFEGPFMNIYDDIYKEIDKYVPHKPVGKHCKEKYCVNSSHFLALGNISELKKETYVELRNRDNGWIKNEVKQELSHQYNGAIAGDIKDLKEKLYTRRIIIYGAGTAAKEIINYLKNNNLLPEMIIVTEKDDSDIEGVPIIQFSDELVSMLTGDTVIIIAVKNYNQVTQIKKTIKSARGYVIDYYDFYKLDDFKLNKKVAI